MGLGSEAGTVAAAVAAASPAPIVHAIGGSVGSALALLLFYPLERARIEMQSAAAANNKSAATATTTATTASSSPVIGEEQRILERLPQPTESDAAAAALPSSSSVSSSSVDSWTTASDPSHTYERFVDAADKSYFLDEAEFSDTLPQRHEQPASTAAAVLVPQPNSHISHHTTKLSKCFLHLWQRNELYRGVTPVVLTLGISNFVFFFVNAWMKQLLVTPRLLVQRNNNNNSHRRYWSLLASCLAGTANVLITNPLWLVSTRITIQQATSSSLWMELWNVVRQQGVGHLWTGTWSSILLVSNPVIQFFLYEQFKEWQLLQTNHIHAAAVGDTLARTATTNLSPVQAFCTGAAAKGIATVLTYPLQLTQAIFRVQQTPNDPTSSDARTTTIQPTKTIYSRGIWDCLVQLYQRDGPAGLYAGMKAKLLLTVLTAAFTFLTYEQILASVHTAHQNWIIKTGISSKLAAATAAVE